ncbi:MAG TPA: VWA domain-containing protein [Thermoanaerobaculia bacterium]|nr:VWA domain-containing protein [Thermoanaerobaculia bacterium]
MRKLLLALLSLPLIAATPKPAQTPDIPHTSESIEVSIVNVDVFVTDKAGNRIKGLTKDDFQILEDGKAQPITNFSEYASDISNEHAGVGVGQALSLSGQPPTSSRQAGELALHHQHRTLVVFIDRFQAPALKSDPVFAQLKELLHKAVRPGDQVTIMTWVHRPYTRLELTDDLGQMDNVIDKISKERHYGYGNEYREIELEEQFDQEIDQFYKQQTGQQRPGGGQKKPVLAALDAAMTEFHDMQAKTKAMNAIIESISGIEGSKSMIYVSRRFSMIAGREFLVDRRDLLAPPTLYEQLKSVRNEVESVAKTANAHGVTMYMLYPAGLDNDWVQSPEDITMPGATDATLAGHSYMTLDNEVQALKYVADQTGGMAAWGVQDVVSLMPLIEQDFNAYYSLAYRATTQRKDRARKIMVKAKNPAYLVRARRQFVEESDETRMKNRVVATLFSDSNDTKIPLRVRLGEKKLNGSGKYLIPVMVEIPVESLVSLPDAKGQRGAFSVYVASGDILGAVSDVTQRTQPFTIADVRRATNGRFEYEFELLTDLKTNRVAVGVYDEISKDYGLQRIELPHAVLTPDTTTQRQEGR